MGCKSAEMCPNNEYYAPCNTHRHGRSKYYRCDSYLEWSLQGENRMSAHVINRTRQKIKKQKMVLSHQLPELSVVRARHTHTHTHSFFILFLWTILWANLNAAALAALFHNKCFSATGRCACQTKVGVYLPVQKIKHCWNMLGRLTGTRCCR